MIPTKKTYLLLLFGIAIAPTGAVIWGIPSGIAATLLFDSIVLTLMVIDGWRVKCDRIQITRQMERRLSIGRDNAIVLTVKSQNSPAQIQVRDLYPIKFSASQPQFVTFLASNTTTDLTYTVCPPKRGEFECGDIQVRQLGAWRLAWNDYRVHQSQKIKV